MEVRCLNAFSLKIFISNCCSGRIEYDPRRPLFIPFHFHPDHTLFFHSIKPYLKKKYLNTYNEKVIITKVFRFSSIETFFAFVFVCLSLDFISFRHPQKENTKMKKGSRVFIVARRWKLVFQHDIPISELSIPGTEPPPLKPEAQTSFPVEPWYNKYKRNQNTTPSE